MQNARIPMASTLTGPAGTQILQIGAPRRNERQGATGSAERRIRRVGNVETLLTERDRRAESRHIAPISREARAWQQSALTMKRL
jgi:hypothetical protein